MAGCAELLENTWTLKKWAGPEQFEDPTGDLMMLPSDMALLWDKGFRTHVERYAKDEDAFFTDFSAVRRCGPTTPARLARVEPCSSPKPESGAAQGITGELRVLEASGGVPTQGKASST